MSEPASEHPNEVMRISGARKLRERHGAFAGAMVGVLAAWWIMRSLDLDPATPHKPIFWLFALLTAAFSVFVFLICVFLGWLVVAVAQGKRSALSPPDEGNQK